MKFAMSVRQLSASLLARSRLYIIDTEGGHRVTQFCSISANESPGRSECLNLYNSTCLRKGSASSFVNRVPLGDMLTVIARYFSRPGKPIVLVGHSAISADSNHLTTLMMRHYQLERKSSAQAHSSIAGYIDTLPLFRRLYPSLHSYKQQYLVKYFLGVHRYNAHNALDDSLMLYYLCNKFLWPLTKENQGLLVEASINNLYCIDRFITKPTKQSIEENLLKNTKYLKRGNKVKLFRTQVLIDQMYPILNKVI